MEKEGFLCLLAIIYGILLTSLRILDLRTYDREVYFERYMFDVDITQLSNMTCDGLVIADFLTYIWIIVVPKVLFYVLFSSLCNFIKIEFLSFNKRIHNLQECTCSRGKIIKLAYHYINACEAVLIIDSIYSSLLFWWFAGALIDITFSCFDIIEKTDFLETLIEKIYYVSIIFFESAFFIILTVQASDVTLESQKEINQLFRLSTYSMNYCPEDREASRILLLRCNLLPPQFTAWKAFYITRSFIFTVFGLISTYLIVLFQLQAPPGSKNSEET
ncbi:gustatory receptor for sugar taste 64a-like [Centruroides vittatus]|uniref:gustatory receptor for sugar taste 64a-like n=1 Tax=Centruroides vittatus TaxID=120091 RepID=UPI003510B611